MTINDDDFSAVTTGKLLIDQLRNEVGAAWPLIYHVINVRGGDRTGRSQWVALVREDNAGNAIVAFAADKEQEKQGR